MSQIMAHRGARDLWAENSALGFREVAKLDFDAIEFDLHLTDAGELVVIHDATLERTTNGAGPVRSLTRDGRRALRLKGPSGALIDEGIPSFDEVLDILGPLRADLYVELKADENGMPYPDMVALAADALRQRGLQDRSVLHSFDISVVREIKNVAPEFRRLISVNREWAARQGGIAAFLAEVNGLVDIVGIHHELYEAEFDLIRSLRPLEATSVWTVNEPELIRRWIARGPGFIVSDNPVLLRELMTESCPA
ncbi:glycerophosphodiester phosphodiesterase family protein [Paracoccus aestuariivivens]|uniref:Glycerophosphodiester phosphodiesterase n=1 Tax=Paracoccus aestuariivivens TaxID=1820333 RepID=A0A6L6JG06_9RHOB|nr:glycerophosphodiester phosphodiesterase family protein [Paracoccus aestuariivivens]MTH79044.1 glycerophosphodiester phosphodiesterase [Paracoccus aestuariivivens]